MITIYEIVNGMDILDRRRLYKDVSQQSIERIPKQIQKDNYMRDVKKYSFLYSSIDKWNQLRRDVVCAVSVSQMKEKLVKCRQRERT